MTTSATLDREHAIRAAVHRQLIAAEGAQRLVGAATHEVRTRVEGLVNAEDPLLTVDRREVLVAEVMNTVLGLGVLEPLLG